MTWIKLDDAFIDHPKVVGLTDGAFRLLVAGMSYCGRWSTDGVIPSGAIKMKPRLLRELISNGNFHEKGHECESCPAIPTGAVYVHDFLVYNPSAEEVETAQGRRTERARKAARARWEHPPSSANGNAPSIPASMPDAMLPDAPVPNPSVVTSLPGDLQPAPPPVDDDEELAQEPQPLDPAAILHRAVIERVATAKWERAVGENATDAYRATVRADVEAKHGARLRALIATHPDGPIECFAGELLGEPNSLHRYRKPEVDA